MKTEPHVSVPSRLQSAVPSNGSRPRHSSLNSTFSSSSSDAPQPLESSSSSSLPSIPDSDTRSERVTRLQKLLASHLTIQSSSSSSSSGSSTVHPSPCPTPSMGSFVTITAIFSIAPQSVLANHQPVLLAPISAQNISALPHIPSPASQPMVPTSLQPHLSSLISHPPPDDSPPQLFSSTSS